MPIYGVHCEACGHEFESFQGMDALLPACPKCGSDDTRKLVSRRTGFVLNGEGWAKDGYTKGKGKSTERA